jgi:hypothetical protein
MKFPIIRWVFSLPASMFYCLATEALHGTLNSPGGVFTSLDALAGFLLPGSVALWVLADARRRGRSLPYDAGSFIYFAWPVLAPIYLFSTRGWRAFAALGCFLLLYLAAALFGSIPFFLTIVSHRSL